MADALIQQGNQAADNNPNANASANTAALSSGTAKDSSGAAITGFGNPNSTQPTVMTPTQAFNNTPTAVPTVTSPNTAPGIVGQGQQTLDSLTASLTPANTPLDNQNQDILNQIAGLTGEDANKGQDTLNMQNQAGIPAKQQALLDAQNELASKTAKYNQLQANLGGNDSVETTAVLAAQNAGLMKAQAADIGITNAKITAAQGNLSLAQQQVTDAINLKYSTIEDQLKTKQAQLAAIAPMLDKQQKTQALAQQQLLQQQAQDLATKKAQETANVQLAMQAQIGTKFVNKNGLFFDTNTGEQFATAQDFFKAAGVTSFEQAYQQGLVTDYTPQKAADIGLVAQMQAKYPDAGIKSTDTVDEATAKLKSSAIYRKDTYIAPNAYTGGGGGTYVPGADPQVDAYITAVKNGNATLTNVPAGMRGLVAQGLAQGSQANTIVDPNTDAQAKAIIAANPNGWQAAADALNKIQPGLATKYDAQLKAVYDGKQDVNSAFGATTTYSPIALSRFTMSSNRIVDNFLKLPQYQLTANGLPYLQRIQAAMQNPGSISDQDLLDSLTKLNTAGNAISDAQVRLITDGKSFSDMADTLKNKFKNGGVLSDSQRQQIQSIAQAIYANYQKGYQPVYDQVTSQLEAAGVPKELWTIPDLNTLSGQSGLGGGQNSSDQPQEGQTGVLNGVTYKFTNGQWISQ